MPLDLRGFAVPTRDYSQDIQRGEELQYRKQVHQEQVAQQKQANQTATTKFLTQYLDPKDRLTGTAYDPEIVHGMDALLQQGIKMAMEGADMGTIMMGLSPGVAKLNTYSTKAKLANEQIKNSLAKVKNIKGYNIEELGALAQKLAFYNEDGTMKDPNDIDLNKDYISLAADEHPELVTNNEGFSTYATGSPKSTRKVDYTTTDSHGNKHQYKFRVTAANWEVPEVSEDGQTHLVPKYEIATDNKQPILHEGKPVRLFDSREFQNMMESNPSIYDHVKGLVKSHIKEYTDPNGKPIDLNDPRAAMIARAIAYDFLSSQSNSTIEEADKQTLSPMQVRINMGGSVPGSGGSGSKSGGTEIRDIYDEVDRLASDAKPGSGAPLNKLSATAQNILLKYARELTGAKAGELNQGNLFIKKNSDGSIDLKLRKDDPNEPDVVIAPIDFGDVNLPANKGTKATQEVLKKGSSKNSKPHSDPLGIF